MTDTRGQHRKIEGDANADRIRSMMEANPYIKPKDIIEATGLHPATVSRHLKNLRAKAEAGRSDA